MRTKTPFLADKMLEVAGRLFGTKRFHEVRMEDIAAEAAVSKGTLYRYFRDKDELYIALLERSSAQLVAVLRALRRGGSELPERLVAFVDAVIDFFDRQPHLFDLIQRAEVQREQGGAFPWQAARDESTRLISEVFELAKRNGEFTLRDASTAIFLLLRRVRALVRFGEHPRPAGLAENLVDDFLQGAARRRKAHAHAGANGSR